jgi:hypothetical protein
MVVPAFTALFASSVDLLVAHLESVGHSCPVVETDLSDYLSEDLVFLDWGRGTFLVQFLRMREI